MISELSTQNLRITGFLHWKGSQSLPPALLPPHTCQLGFHPLPPYHQFTGDLDKVTKLIEAKQGLQRTQMPQLPAQCPFPSSHSAIRRKRFLARASYIVLSKILKRQQLNKQIRFSRVSSMANPYQLTLSKS